MAEARIAWLSPDGSGGGTIDGGTVRVPGSLPGDTVTYEPGSRRGRAVTGTLTVVSTPSPHRRAPSCPHDAVCGGCDLSAFAPAGRLPALAHMAGRALGIDAPEVVSGPELGTRARITLAIDGPTIGYRGSRSHALVDVQDCETARPEVRAALSRLRAWRADHPDAPVTGVEIRGDGERAIYAFRGLPPARHAIAELGDVALEGRAVSGNPVLRIPVAGMRLYASPSSFYQVNLGLNDQLVAYVGDALAAVSAERVLDLYCGIGNLGLPLVRGGTPVVAVERSGQSLSDLRRTAEELDLTVETLAIDARKFDPTRTPFDAAILDPPRAGAGDVMGRVLRNRPRRVVLISCDLKAAGRDVRAATKAGYTLTEVRCFDLFPRTHHIETVSILDRGASRIR